MSSKESPFRIAIVGGGIGGLFCALSLHHHCSSTSARIIIDVYEQASQYKEIGAGVGIGINAVKLIHKLGLGDRLNAIAGDKQGIWMSFRKFDNSAEIVTLPLYDKGEIRQAPCARSGFLDLLKEAVKERKAATLHTKKGFQRVKDRGDSVTIHFMDGSSTDANLVIACDGIHSAVRNQFTFDKPMSSGMIAYRGVVPISSIAQWPFPGYSVTWLAKGRHFLVYPISRNRDLNIVAFITKGEEGVADVKESWTSTCERQDVENDFAGFDGCVQELISLMDDKPSKWLINDRTPLDQWHYLEGKIVLLGDAAHAMTPHLGAGAGQSIEDGWVLGRVISDYLSPEAEANPRLASLNAATQLYQDVRLPRAQKTQATSRAAGNTYQMQTVDMLDKSIEECIPLIAERTTARMRGVWEEDLDVSYEKIRDGVTNGNVGMANGTSQR